MFPSHESRPATTTDAFTRLHVSSVLDHAIHMAAVAQISKPASIGWAYYDKKRSVGSSHSELLGGWVLGRRRVLPCLHLLPATNRLCVRLENEGSGILGRRHRRNLLWASAGIGNRPDPLERRSEFRVSR